MDPDEITYKELLSKNKALSDELQQCVQDKEFVWNLWKELQVAKPNTANIVNSVIEREQEKSDAKDFKVLTVLQEKDKQINILEEISADLQTQLTHTNGRISELLIQESDWQKKYDGFDLEINQLKAEIDYKDQLQITKDNNSKEQITELEEKIEELLKVNKSLQDNLNCLNENLKNISKEKDDLKGNIISKEENVLSTNAKLDTLSKEKDILIADNEVFKTNVTKLKAVIKTKTKEIESVKENWENEMNKNIQIINEQGEHSEQQEHEILSLKKELKDHGNCTQRIEDQKHLIEKLEKLQDESQIIFKQQQCTYEVEINLCKKTISTLKKKVLQLQKEIKKTATENGEANLPQGYPIGNNNDEKTNLSSKHTDKCTQTLLVRDSVDIDNYQSTESGIQPENVEMLVSLIKSMEVDIETTRTAHKQRLQRYKLLEENSNLLRQQLATYEGGSIKKENKIVRASAKSLQREGSKSVWNELEYYRQHYEKYKFERPKLNEELDELKVKQSHNDMLINKLKIQLEGFKKLSDEKDMEIEKKEKEKCLDLSRIQCFQDEIESYYEKTNVIEKEYCELEKIYKTQITREEMLQTQLTSLVSEIEFLKSNINPVMGDGETQTYCNDKEVIPEVLPEICLLSVATQTFTERMNFQYVENATQTIETNKSVLQSELENLKIVEEKDRLSFEYQQLKLLKDALQQENERLKIKKLSLKKEAAKLKERETSICKHVNNLESANEKLKDELLESLQQLKETTQLLEGRSREVEDYSQELNIALSNEQKGKIISKNKFKEIKSLQDELEEAISNCSKLSFQVKTLSGENEILTSKQSSFQGRVGKLEKDLIQKKSQVNELKLKCEESKNEASQNYNIIENLKSKFKTLTEREGSKQLHFEQLKLKIDTLVKDKCKLEKSLSSLKVENNNKTQLLQETQQLCHQAEVVISEMELSSCTQIEKEQKQFKDEHNKMNSSYQKSLKQVKEFQSAVKKFCEAIISMICENHTKIMEINKQKKYKVMKEKQCNLFENKSSNIACSILGMSTQDLVEFMNEDTCIEKNYWRYDDNEMRIKIDVILKKEVHFEKVLFQFLLDLVKYNEKLFHEQLTME